MTCPLFRVPYFGYCLCVRETVQNLLGCVPCNNCSLRIAFYSRFFGLLVHYRCEYRCLGDPGWTRVDVLPNTWGDTPKSVDPYPWW